MHAGVKTFPGLQLWSETFV